MNSNSPTAPPPSAAETLALIERFASGVKDLAEREGRINYAEKLHESERRQSIEEERARAETQAEQRAGQLREECERRKELVASVRKSRTARIEKAQLRLRTEVATGLREREGHYRFGLQQKMREADQRRETGLRETDAQLEMALAAVREQDERFGPIEKRALKALRGFRPLRGKLRESLASRGNASSGETDAAGTPLFDDLYRTCGKGVAAFAKKGIPALFAGFPLTLQLVLTIGLGAAAPWLLEKLGVENVDWRPCLVAAGGVAALILLLYATGWSQAKAFLCKTGGKLREARRLRESLRASATRVHDERVQEIETEHQRARAEFEAGLKSKGPEKPDLRYSNPEAVEKRAAQLKERLQRNAERRLARLDSRLEADLAETERDRVSLLALLEAEGQGGDGDDPPALDFDTQRSNLQEEWRSEVLSDERLLLDEQPRTGSGESPGGGTGAASGNSGKDIPETSGHASSDPLSGSPEDWTPPAAFAERLDIGTLSFSLEEADIQFRENTRLALRGDDRYEVPLRLGFPGLGSLLIETKHTGREQAVAALNRAVLALLAGSPPGRLAFSLFDPVGLGESFAGLMHLADYEEILINTRIRTRSEQIEQRLGELCEHMEKVIQMYLRNEYETISEYNVAAGNIAERYHFVVAADCPAQFSDEAARRLLSIASAGARCGVFLLLHFDERAERPQTLAMEDLRKACLCLRPDGDGFALRDAPLPGMKVHLHQPPPNDAFLAWVRRLGEANRDSSRVEVPFSQIAPADDERWSRATREELRVPIGRTGATKRQELALGKGTRQHALIAGKTGSGKSTLFHVIVTNLALWCDPDQVEFYLIDFKKGVEFKCYADGKLPHARVVAIESDREFGLSVLQRLDAELRERGEKFRQLGVQDLAGYSKAGGRDPMPRTLLLIDEFQEFFTEDDAVAQEAAVLLDRIVRQGRAFGLHAILGSQTLGGAFTLARATLGQMAVRIALQCNEADAYLIMDDENPAPRLLTRPGEGIYNDSAGAAEANSPFQVVWMEEDERDAHLAEVAALARERGLDGKPRVVFEGNAPARIEEDQTVAALLDAAETAGTGAKAGTGEKAGKGGPSASSPAPAGPPRLLLGAPNAIKGPTEVLFERQSGSHLLVVGQREDAIEAMAAVGLRLLRAQLGDRCRLVLADTRLSDPNQPSWLKEILPALPGVEIPEAHEIGDAVNGLAAELKKRAETGGNADRESLFLFVLGLQRIKALRHEEDFSFSLDEEEGEAKPSASFNELIEEGPAHGIHVVAALDTYNNVNRCLSRKALAEFEKKVLFQMSAADSASLIDTGQASNLGMNRALCHNEATGVAEIFRPWSPPGKEWFG